MVCTAIIILILAPFLLSGNYNAAAIFVVLADSLLLFILNRKNQVIERTIPNIALALFSISIIILLPFSLLVERSASIVIWWVGYSGVFFFCQTLAKRERLLEKSSKFFVLATAFFGVYSLACFVNVGLNSYTRLDGLIGQHNVYGGFLVLPFFLSILFLIQENKLWKKVSWLVSSAIITASLILTFSRGTWVTIIFAIALALIILRKKIVWKPNRVGIKYCASMAILSFIIVCGVWQLAKQNTPEPGSLGTSAIGVFAQQNIEENAFVARLHYFGDAWNSFLGRPLIGYGQGTYPFALRMHKLDPSYASFEDPHNWLLKMLVENGLIATILFVIFIVALFWAIWRLAMKSVERSWLEISIFTGLLASAVHGLMDFDWSINLSLFIFFLFAGLLYGSSLKADPSSSKGVLNFPEWSSYLLVAMIIIGSIISIQIFRADYMRAKGDVYLYQNSDSNSAINSYFKSLTINQYDPTTWFSLWKVYFSAENYVAAKNCINKAISMFPENGIYYGALARTDEALGNYTDYHDTLLKAVKYFPANDLSYYVKLVEFDISQRKYDEPLVMIDEILPIYSKYRSALWFKSDPNSDTISQNIDRLYEYKKQIEDTVAKPLVGSSTK